MYLYIMRHGDAANAATDDLRPLSAWGIEQVKSVSRLAAEQLENTPDIVWHSEKQRAMETAALLCEVLSPAQGMEEHAHLLPEDNPAAWPILLKQESRDIMLVSHMPLVSGLLAELLPPASPEVRAFQTAELHCLKRDNEGYWHWQWRILPAV